MENGERVEFIYTISKNAFNLIRNGDASLQSGGVRALDGSFIELATPGAQDVINDVPHFLIPGTFFTGITMISSIVGNIQNVCIQQGVNEANRKLDALLVGQNNILNNLYNIQELQLTNLALGLINVGVSLEYLPKIEQQINEINNTLNELKVHIERQEIHQCIREYNKYSSSMLNCLDKMTDGEAIDPDKLSEVEAYLKSIILQFNNHDIDGTIACKIIFGLIPSYVQVVKMYSSNYYWKHKRNPNVYTKCIEVLKAMNQDAFCESLKKYLLINCPNLTMEEKYKSLSGITTSIENSIGNLEFEKIIWKMFPQKVYNKLDEVATNIIRSEDAMIKCDENRVYIPINTDNMFKVRECIDNYK